MYEISQLNFSSERALSLLKAQQNAAIDGILVIDEHRKVLSYNKRFLELWQIPDEIARLGEDAPLLGHVVSNVQDSQAFIGKVMYLYEHPLENSRDEILLLDGKVFDRYSSPIIDDDGSHLGRIWFFRDITTRKNMETQLKSQTAELEDKAELLKENSIALQASLEAVKQVNEELKSAFEQLNEKNIEVQRKNQNITASIHYASRIQKAMLPEDTHLLAFFSDYFVLNRPRDIVSGDFYWCDGIGNKHFLVVADCTGHGIPGAFMSMLGIAGLTDIILQKEITQAGEILAHLHLYISHSLRQTTTASQDGMEMVIIVHDKSTNQVEYAGAMNAMFYIQKEELLEIKATKLPIGGSQHGANRQYQSHIIEVDKSTMFYLTTDGYQDQFGGPINRKFTIGRMKKLFLEIHQQPVATQKNILDTTFEDWRIEGKEEQIDDMLLIGVRIGKNSKRKRSVKVIEEPQITTS
jgi:serine phosphatase RsbU (regulator of sigma subunit)